MRVRKNINDLTDKQRRRYVICVKMLAVLPPPAKMNFPGDLRFVTPGFKPEGVDYPKNYIKPKCLHDILISSFTSVCNIPVDNPNDPTKYFGAYHRHLLVLYEFLLTYVDYVLKNYTLDQISKLFSPPLSGQAKIRLGLIIKEYKDLVLNLPAIAAHYWNPANYSSDQDLKVPSEFTIQDVVDNVNNLMLQIFDHLPSQTKPYTRWYQFGPDPDGQYDTVKPDLITKLVSQGAFYDAPFEYTTDEQDILDGKLAPRPKPKFSCFYKQYSRMNLLPESLTDSLTANVPDTMKQAWNKNRADFINSDRILLYPLRKNEQIVDFGANIFYNGTQYELQYLTPEEIYDQPDTDTKYEMRQYNNTLTYYQQAYALYNFKVHQFMRFIGPTNGYVRDTSFGQAAQTELGSSLFDGPFGVYNLLFFAYHSWIDALFQMSLSNHTSSQDVADTENFYNGLADTNNLQILDWIDPEFIRPVGTGFGVLDYVIKSDNTYRLASQLDQIYGTYFTKFRLPFLNNHDPNYQYLISGAGNSQKPNRKSKNNNKTSRGNLQLQPPYYLEQIKEPVVGYKTFINEFVKSTSHSEQGTKLLVNLLRRGFVFDIKIPGSRGQIVKLGAIKLNFKFDQLVEMIDRKQFQRVRSILSQQTSERVINIFEYQQNQRRLSNGRPADQIVLWTETPIQKKKKDELVQDSAIEEENGEGNQMDQEIFTIEGDGSTFNRKFIQVKGAGEIKFEVKFETKRRNKNNFQFEATVVTQDNLNPLKFRKITKYIQSDDFQYTGKKDHRFAFSSQKGLEFKNIPNQAVQAGSALDGEVYTKVLLKVAINKLQKEFDIKLYGYNPSIKFQVSLIQENQELKLQGRRIYGKNTVKRLVPLKRRR